ncbi:hypothetical protein D3C77_498080 [compost metagenome]
MKGMIIMGFRTTGRPNMIGSEMLKNDDGRPNLPIERHCSLRALNASSNTNAIMLPEPPKFRKIELV